MARQFITGPNSGPAMVFLKYSANFSFSEAAYRGLPYLTKENRIGGT